MTQPLHLTTPKLHDDGIRSSILQSIGLTYPKRLAIALLWLR
ncbi:MULTISPECIES: hypothetical protein [Cyanophyceae]|nr:MULTISPECIES: hypothetical protein [Cyanophyceae]